MAGCVRVHQAVGQKLLQWQPPPALQRRPQVLQQSAARQARRRRHVVTGRLVLAWRDTLQASAAAAASRLPRCLRLGSLGCLLVRWQAQLPGAIREGRSLPLQHAQRAPQPHPVRPVWDSLLHAAAIAAALRCSCCRGCIPAGALLLRLLPLLASG